MTTSYLFAMALLPAGCGGSSRAPAVPAAATKAEIRRAEDHERARRYDLARERYEAAVASAADPASGAFAAHRFASALAFWGELEAAATRLEQAVELDPKRASAWHDLGIIRAKLHRFEAGEAALRRAVTLVPRDPRPRIALAALLVKTRRFGEARAEYVELLDLDLPQKTRSAIKRALELLE